MVEEVENAPVTLLWMDANSSDLMRIMIVKTLMVRITQDFLVYKFSEEEQAASVSPVTSTQEHQPMVELLSASDTLAVELDHLLKLKFKLELIR